MLASLLGSISTAIAEDTLPPIPAIPRILPPPGIEVPAEKLQAIKEQLGKLRDRFDHTFDASPDVAIFEKAVRYAIDNGEFFDAKELKIADDLIAEANRRLDNPESWQPTSGPVVRGFRSLIDGSIQPYGVVIPADLPIPGPKDLPTPIYVWLHGRGDKMTDLQFIGQRMTKPGEFAPKNGIVVHPFGRYCNAFKFAGERDVFECVGAVQRQYPQYSKLSPTRQQYPRVILAGFSMGGAGAWHLGAHHPGVWRAVSPGAGFAETARYQNLTPDKYPPWYEQKLWALYDVPGYVRNLFNAPTIAYSGEEDKQIQAARVMEEAFAKEGQELTHLIGPGMGHKYHPDVLKDLTSRLEQYADQRPWKDIGRLTLQTHTLRYARISGSPGDLVRIEQLEQSWKESRLDIARRVLAEAPLVERVDKSNTYGPVAINVGSVDHLNTRNVQAFALHVKDLPDRHVLVVDSQNVEISRSVRNKTAGNAYFLGRDILLRKHDGRWKYEEDSKTLVDGSGSIAKQPRLQGPIDDAFYDPFIVVIPSGKSNHPQVERWVQFELAHFKDRWRRLFRGDVRVKKDSELTADDHINYHLIAWGDVNSNQMIKSIAENLPIKCTNEKIIVGEKSYDSSGHVPVLIYPNPKSPPSSRRYIVINSGPTFREEHDKSNSLQTPKLPDWAVVDLSVLPDGKAPGRIADAGFFDEQWKYQPRKAE